MKATLYDGSRKVMVDTDQDACLFSGPHPLPKSADVKVYEKDLYLHENKDNRDQYYFHIRPSGKIGKNKIIPVSPVMAERYLMKKGITCNQFPQNESVSRLYSWGYGIVEEF